MVTFCGLLLWWGNGGKEGWHKMRDNPSGFGISVFGSEIIKDLQFFPASNPKIHVSNSGSDTGFSSTDYNAVCWPVDFVPE
jgi:hypothetical protein